MKNVWRETDLFNLNVDHDISVQFSKHDNDLVYDDDFDLSAPTRSRRGTTGDKAKVESRRKARVCCGKF